jgi:hypothetical protein
MNIRRCVALPAWQSAACALLVVALSLADHMHAQEKVAADKVIGNSKAESSPAACAKDNIRSDGTSEAGGWGGPCCVRPDF